MQHAIRSLILLLAAFLAFAAPALADEKMSVVFACSPGGDVGRALCAHMEEQFAMSPLFRVIQEAPAASTVMVHMRTADLEDSSKAAYSCVVTRKMDDAPDGPERYLFNELGMCSVKSSECVADKLLKDVYSMAR
jgi:hypothetical protein